MLVLFSFENGKSGKNGLVGNEERFNTMCGYNDANKIKAKGKKHL